MRAALLVMVLSVPAFAADDYDAPIAQLTPFLGARSGSGTGDAIIGGVGLSGGWRIYAVRFGLSIRILGTSAYAPLPAWDAGGFISGDVLSAWIDPQLSVGLFLRLEAYARFSGTRDPGFIPLGMVGLRLAGIEIGLAGGPEFGLKLGPSGGAGGVFEFRLGVELIELARAIKHGVDSKLPQPP